MTAASGNLLVLVRHGRERVEQAQSLHRLERPRSYREGRNRSQGGRAEDEGRGPQLRPRFHECTAPSAADAAADPDELGTDGHSGHQDEKLNERDYGDLSGLNKDEARVKMGRGAGPHLAPQLRTCRRRAARASRIPLRACFPTSTPPSCRSCRPVKTCSSRRTATRCARSSCSSKA